MMKSQRTSRFAVVVAVAAVGFSVASPARADGGEGDGGGPIAFLAGMVTGALAAPYVAAPPPAPVYVQPSVVYAPPPAYVYAPAPAPYVYQPAPRYGWRGREDHHREDH